MESSQGHVLFSLLHWTVVMSFDSYSTTFLLTLYHKKAWIPFLFNFEHWKNCWMRKCNYVWCQTSRTHTNVKTRVESCQECDILVLLRPSPSLCTSGPSCSCHQNNRSCENIFKHLSGEFEAKCLPSLDGSWSALSCLPVLPSRNESTNWQWSSPKPDWSPMLWNLPGR